MKITEQWISELAALLDSADLDGAVVHMADIQPQDFGEDLERRLGAALGLKARCLMCEVYDYAGRKQDGIACIKIAGEKAYANLELVERETTKGLMRAIYDLQRLQDLKQQCWACLHLGMLCEYRHQEYKKALPYFILAKTMLERIEAAAPEQVDCGGVLARAHYCLGLVEREIHNLYIARKHFSISIGYAWKSIARKEARGAPIAFMEYSIGRALGLGMAWIAYARASMSESNAHSVAARLILKDTRVKYLRLYVDVVHACSERSGANNVGSITNAITAMEHAYRQLGGGELLRDREKVEGHFVYAQRAAYELATAYVCAARLRGVEDQAQTAKDLAMALDYVALVENSLSVEPNQRTKCNTFITQSRILREMRDFPGALKAAEEACRVGKDNPFSRIDCWITLGEAYYHSERYEEALQQFKQARDDKRAQTNPKVVAVCDLQIARCHVKLNDVDAARGIMTQWQRSGYPGNANEFVQYLEKELAKDLSFHDAPFVVPGETENEDLNIDEWVVKLKQWLVALALKRTNNRKTLAAKYLGVNEKTVREHSKQEQAGREKTRAADGDLSSPES